MTEIRERTMKISRLLAFLRSSVRRSVAPYSIPFRINDNYAVVSFVLLDPSSEPTYHSPINDLRGLLSRIADEDPRLDLGIVSGQINEQTLAEARYKNFGGGDEELNIPLVDRTSFALSKGHSF